MLRSGLILGTLLGVALLPGRSTGIEHQAQVVATSLRHLATDMVSSRTPCWSLASMAPIADTGTADHAGQASDNRRLDARWNVRRPREPLATLLVGASVGGHSERVSARGHGHLRGSRRRGTRAATIQVSLKSQSPHRTAHVCGTLAAQRRRRGHQPHAAGESGTSPFSGDLLSGSGIKTAVIRFFFSFPADGQADLVISNWAGQDEFARLGVRTAATSGLAAPAEEARHLLASFADDHVLDRTLLLSMVERPDWPTPRDAVVDPIAMLKDATDIDQRSVDAAVALLRRHPDTRVVALYLGGNDSVSHAFWQYRFPEAFGETAPASTTCESSARSSIGSWDYLDRNLARVIAEFPATPNVLVVSDHGLESSRIRPLWKGQHSARGVFVASGPDIPRAPTRISVSLFDVAPTIFQIMDLEKPSGMPGRSTHHSG